MDVALVFFIYNFFDLLITSFIVIQVLFFTIINILYMFIFITFSFNTILILQEIILFYKIKS